MDFWEPGIALAGLLVQLAAGSVLFTLWGRTLFLKPVLNPRSVCTWVCRPCLLLGRRVWSALVFPGYLGLLGEQDCLSLQTAVGICRSAFPMASRADLFKRAWKKQLVLTDFSCLQLLWKPHFPYLMVTDAASDLKLARTCSCKEPPGAVSAALHQLAGTPAHCMSVWCTPAVVCPAQPLRACPCCCLFSQYQNYKGSSCSSECIHAAVLSARRICGRVAEGAWMSDGTEVNAAEAVGGRRRLGAGSPTIVMRSLQWCIQAQRAVRSFHSPSHWNSDCFCLGHAFVSVISGVVPWCQCFSEAHLDFPSKCAAAPMAQHILLSSLLGTHRNSEWFEL